MDPATKAYYDDHAAELARRYDAAPDGVSGWFAQAFEGRTTVLDVGCGSGRDVRRLVKLGFDARGVDASAAMIDQARAAARAEGAGEDRFTVASLPALEGQADETYDAVLCCAVLMHIPDEHLFDAVYGLRRVLRPGGRLLVSIPERRPDVDPATSRDPHGRLFAPLVPDKLSLLIERIGFRPVWRKTTADSLARPGHAWTTMHWESVGLSFTYSIDQP